MKDSVLFIGGTHGNEPIGVNVLKRLAEKRQDFDWIIGNPLAMEAGTREFEGDLNRSAPGNSQAPEYAKRRAAEVLATAQNYRYVIDLHGSNKNCGIFTIVTNPSKENLELAARLPIKRVVVWPSISPELAGPLSEYFTCGVEIENGLKDLPESETKLEKILESFLDGQQNTEVQEIYEVYGSLTKEVPEGLLQEFREATLDGETFFPLLIGSYLRNGVVCYKLRRRAPHPKIST